MPDYDYRSCQSLFGYAMTVHARSGGICQLCGAGSANIDFDLWRQMTVEHLIGESQGGYLREIRASLVQRFPDWDSKTITNISGQIEAANTITACFFCNSTTSRDRAPVAMSEVIEDAPDASPAEIYRHVTADLGRILATKRQNVVWRLEAVRKAFDALVAPGLTETRNSASTVEEST